MNSNARQKNWWSAENLFSSCWSPAMLQPSEQTEHKGLKREIIVGVINEMQNISSDYA